MKLMKLNEGSKGPAVARNNPLHCVEGTRECATHVPFDSSPWNEFWRGDNYDNGGA